MAERAEVEGLVSRFDERLRPLGLAGGPVQLLVAVSGGCDSMVLLHLLRFHARHLPIELAVAHLDHAMRAESASDRLWLQGVCRAWEIPFLSERLDRAPANEEEARRERYRFLRAAAGECGASMILTAHQADDQAETVLFRVLRGTGLRGLRGIPERSAGGVVRPLLPFWRSELEAYGLAVKLRWRRDRTNDDLHPSRNRIRNRMIPEAEATFAPAARRNLIALARHAEEAEAALERLAKGVVERAVTADGDGYLLDRRVLAEYDPATRARVLRRLLRRLGVTLGRAGTRSALQFITHAPSGRHIHLPGGLRMAVEFDCVRVGPETAVEQDLPVDVPAPEGRDWSGEARVGGVRYDVSARSGTAGADAPGPWTAVLPLKRLSFPLQVRGWQPGDRMRTAGGTKALKKLFLEMRVSRTRRHQLPVVVDAEGSVLWVGGLHRLRLPAPATGSDALILTITNDR